jgi:hypothetical protein
LLLPQERLQGDLRVSLQEYFPQKKFAKILPKTPVTMVKIRENQPVRQWSKFV